MYSRGTQTLNYQNNGGDEVLESQSTTQEASKDEVETIKEKNGDNPYLDEKNEYLDKVDLDEEYNKSQNSQTLIIMDEEKKYETLQTNDFKSFLNKANVVSNRALFINDRYDVLQGTFDNFISVQKNQPVSKLCIEFKGSLLDKEHTLNLQINDIDWNPFEPSKIISTSFDENGNSGSSILEWNLDYEGMIESRLNASSYRVTGIKYWNCEDHIYNTSVGGGRIIIGGTYTGQVILWDTRIAGNNGPILSTSNTKVNLSSTNSSPHQNPIYNIQLIDNHHFASVDTFGTLAIWDIYKMQHCVEELVLTSNSLQDIKTQTNREVPVTAMTFKDENTFFIGSDDGSIYSGQRHGDRKGLINKYQYHHATISSIKSHPTRDSFRQKFASKNLKNQNLDNKNSNNINELLLSSSLDWSVSLWHPRLSSSPLATFNDFTDYVMDVAWSNHHPAIFAAADSSGTLSIWNINSKDRDVAQMTTSHSSPHALNKVIWSPHQPDLLVSSSHSNTINIFKADTEAVTPSGDEWSKLEETISLLKSNL